MRIIHCLFLAMCFFISLANHFVWAQEKNAAIDVRFIRDTFTPVFYGGPSLTDSNPELFSSFNYIKPNQSIYHVSSYYDKTLFEQTYEIGEFGFRIIPRKLYSPKADKHLIIAGDSNTFGIGVADRETLPVLLADNKKNYRPYNFGIRGGAPNCSLGLMEFFPWEKVIHEKKGYFIYNYYDFLIDRVIGSKNYIGWNEGNSPEYQLNASGEAVYIGHFRDRFLTQVYKTIISIKWLNELLPQLPRHRRHHSVLVTKIFLKMKQQYLNKFPEGKFIVALNFSFPEMVTGRLEELKEELIKNNIAYIILPKEEFGDNFKLEDGHLSAEGHKTEADLIEKYLQ